MNLDRSYGTSAYKPTHHAGALERSTQRTSGQKEEKPKHPQSLQKKTLHIALAIVAVVLFLLWLSLGEFRFLFWRAPSFTGFPFGTRSYLILTTNQYGLLTFSHGLYTGVEWHERDELEELLVSADLEIPLELSTLNKDADALDALLFEPDFRTVQGNLVQAFEAENLEVDGVLTIDQSTLDELSFWSPFESRNRLTQAFHEKDALLSFTREGLAESVRERNWDGALPQSDMGDFVAINLFNAVQNSGARALTRDVQYEVVVTSKEDILGMPILKAQLSVTLSNESLTSAYIGYLRSMIPLGADLIQASTIKDEREDSIVMGELVRLEPGASVTYQYEYELPEYVWYQGTYYLHLHKQPGMDLDQYRVLLKASPGTTFDAPYFIVHGANAFLSTVLPTDIDLSFALAEGEVEPELAPEPEVEPELAPEPEPQLESEETENSVDESAETSDTVGENE